MALLEPAGLAGSAVFQIGPLECSFMPAGGSRREVPMTSRLRANLPGAGRKKGHFMPMSRRLQVVGRYLAIGLAWGLPDVWQRQACGQRHQSRPPATLEARPITMPDGQSGRDCKMPRITKDRQLQGWKAQGEHPFHRGIMCRKQKIGDQHHEDTDRHQICLGALHH